jgi:hypothetical protein
MEYELFNIKRDIGENNNLFMTKKDIAKRLAAELRSFLINVDAQMPINMQTGKPVPLPEA